jgi:hypothetical protein
MQHENNISFKAVPSEDLQVLVHDPEQPLVESRHLPADLKVDQGCLKLPAGVCRRAFDIGHRGVQAESGELVGDRACLIETGPFLPGIDGLLGLPFEILQH